MPKHPNDNCTAYALMQRHLAQQHMARSPIPALVGGAPVIAYTPLDQRHTPMNTTKPITQKADRSHPLGLAICRYTDQPGYYLFACDQDWNTLADTWHETLDDALDQAEFEYSGARATFIRTNIP